MQCKPRDAGIRDTLLAQYTPEYCEQHKCRSTAFSAFADAGVQPFLRSALDDPKYAVIMGGLAAVDHLVGDYLHVVCTCLLPVTSHTSTRVGVLACTHVDWRGNDEACDGSASSVPGHSDHVTAGTH